MIEDRKRKSITLSESDLTFLQPCECEGVQNRVDCGEYLNIQIDNVDNKHHMIEILYHTSIQSKSILGNIFPEQ